MTDAHIPPLAGAMADDGGKASSTSPCGATGAQGDLFGDDQRGARPREKRGKTEGIGGARKRPSAAPAKRTRKAARPRGAHTGTKTSLAQQDAEREKLFLQRLMELGDSAYELARDNMGLAGHEPDEEVRVKHVGIASRCSDVWLKLSGKEYEVRGRMAARA